jgi:hypothetical protein
MSLHRRAMDAERHSAFHLSELMFLEIAASRRIADNADRMPSGDLRLGQVAHVTKNPSDR